MQIKSIALTGSNPHQSLQALTAGIAIAAPDGSADLKAGSVIEAMFMPAGTYECTFGVLGRNQAVTRQIKITPASARALNDQLAAVKAKTSHRPYFDFDHESRQASMWPTEFFWRDQPAGVFYRAEASSAGAEAISGKTYRAFSPVFYPDSKNDPAGIACNPDADLNFGGLVNDPAFKSISPLWAKNAAGAPSSASTEIDMEKTQQELVALQASVKTLEQEIRALTGKAGTDAVAVADLRAAKAELKAVQAEILAASESEKVISLTAKNKEITDGDTARRKKFATDAVGEVVKRGAIKPKDDALIARYTKLIEEDETNVVMLAGLPSDPALSSRRVAERPALHSTEGPKNMMLAYGALVGKNTGIRGLGPESFLQKGELAREMSGLYAKALKEHGALFMDQPLTGADFVDAAGNLGTLSGTLVAQRCLELFKYDFPIVSELWTDFSDMPAEFKQTTTTRIIVTPPVQTFNAAINANTGLPTGWINAAAGQTKDVPVTLDEHVGVPIIFDANMLASTSRRLFDEQAPAASYALGKYFVEKIYKVLTPANFNAYAAVSGSKIPIAYATFAKGLGDFARSSLVDLGVIFDNNEVPTANRFVLLNSAYHGQLEKDPSLVTFYAGQQAPEIVTGRKLPMLADFKVVKAPNLTNNNNTANLVGFAGHKASAIIKTRLSNDYTQALPGASYGSVTTITNPDAGFSVVLVQYVNHDGGFAAWRLQVMLGAASGDNRGGLCITSQ